MCGIAGIVQFSGPLNPNAIWQMTRSLRHRGPDDEGYLLVNHRPTPYGGPDTPGTLGLPSIERAAPGDYHVAFGHRRLSILDLSPAGHQPMVSDDGSCWVIFNGEIYNYIELREELIGRGYRFHSGSDTEVILAAYREWGPDCVRRFTGMFAFALWDATRRHVFCARGHFGIKPFYYWYDGRQFRFASEIKALLADGAVAPVAHDHMVFDYLADGRLDHTSETFFRGIYQLPPAHYLLLDLNQPAPRQLAPTHYWDLNPERDVTGWDDGQYARRFGKLLEDSIRIQLRSDVAIGTCLSGGLDSSTIVCIVNRLLREDGASLSQIGDRQKTFSSCFEDRRFDERKYIEEVLKVTGAESNFVFPDVRELMDEVPKLIWHQDEPFTSTSIYAQWSVFRRAAERGVKVMLDGQGGDELLAGYPDYTPFFLLDELYQGSLATFLREWSRHRVGPRPTARAMIGIATSAWMNKPKQYLKQWLRPPSPQRYPWVAPGFTRAYAWSEDWAERKYQDLLRERLHRELLGGLSSLLRYEDRNSMAFSIEARVPFLDRRLAEFVFGLPADQRIRDGLTKYVLREATRGVLPEPIRARTDKMGFVTPEIVWFQERLAQFARVAMEDAPSQVRVYLNPPEIEKMIREAETANATKTTVNRLWRVLNLCLWFKVFQVNRATTRPDPTKDLQLATT